MFSFKLSLFATAALATFAAALPVAPLVPATGVVSSIANSVRDVNIKPDTELDVSLIEVEGRGTEAIDALIKSVNTGLNERYTKRDGASSPIGSLPPLVLQASLNLVQTLDQVKGLGAVEKVDASAVTSALANVQAALEQAKADIQALPKTLDVNQLLTLQGRVITVSELAQMVMSLIWVVAQIVEAVLAVLVKVVDEDVKGIVANLVPTICELLVAILVLLFNLVDTLKVTLVPLVTESVIALLQRVNFNIALELLK